MLTYRVEGSILVLTAAGETSLQQREAAFTAIRNDPNVPDGALLLLDAREFSEILNAKTVQERVRSLVGELGPKLGLVCAVVMPLERTLDLHFFQSMGPELGLRVGLFQHEGAARRWLRSYLPAS